MPNFKTDRSQDELLMQDQTSVAKSRQGIQVIARAADILRTLENEGDGLSLTQISKRVELPRSTVQRPLLLTYRLLPTTRGAK